MFSKKPFSIQIVFKIIMFEFEVTFFIESAIIFVNAQHWEEKRSIVVVL